VDNNFAPNLTKTTEKRRKGFVLLRLNHSILFLSFKLGFILQAVRSNLPANLLKSNVNSRITPKTQYNFGASCSFLSFDIA